MARTSSVTREKVFAACRSIFAAGEHVSFARVFAALGSKGSGRVVNDFIRDWRAETGDQLAQQSARSLPGVPEELVAALDGLLQNTWQTALEQSELAYEKARDQLDRERLDIQFELDTALEKVASADLEALRLAGEIKARQVELDGKSEALQDALRRLGEASVALTERTEQLAGLREDLARALQNVESAHASHAAELATLRDRHADEIALERHRGDEKLAAAERKYQGELEREQAIHQGERQHLMSTTDALRTTAKQAADSLREQLENAKTLESDLRRRASAAESEAARWHGQTEVLKSQIADERMRADTFERELRARIVEKSPDTLAGAE